MSKCKGCGLTLQNIDSKALGYTKDLNNKLCERCFKITHYSFHENRGKDINNEDIIKKINSKKAFTFFLCDFLAFNNKALSLYNDIKNEKVFVLTKADILPSNIKMTSLMERLKNNFGLEKVLIVSTYNDYGIDSLIHEIKRHDRVLFVGPSSSGKSTLINYLFDYELTTSFYQNTTQEFITLNVEGKEIIDAPGFILDDMKDMKLKNKILPKTIFLKSDYELIIDDLILQVEKDCNLTLYFPKEIMIKTKKKTENLTTEIFIEDNNDLCLKNIGFIYFKKGTSVMVNNQSIIDIHKSLVGGK